MWKHISKIKYHHHHRDDDDEENHIELKSAAVFFAILSFIYSFRRYAKGWIKLNHIFLCVENLWLSTDLLVCGCAEEYLKSKHSSNLSLTAWKGENDRNYLPLSSSFFIIWQRLWPFRWLYICMAWIWKSLVHIFIQSTIFEKGRTAKIYASQKSSNKWQQNELLSVK